MKLKNTLLASALLSAAAFSVHAATELTPEQAAALKPYDRIVITGRFNAIADVYKADAPKADAPKNRVINGIVELPKDQAVQLEPYDTVTVQGFYRSQPEVNDAITKAAKQKGAYAFYIVRQIDANQGGNQRITAFIYKQDAKKRIVQSPDAILAERRSRPFLRNAILQRRTLHCHTSGWHKS